MHQKIFTALVVFFAVLLQVSFFPNLVPGRVFPDIALIVVIFWALRQGFDETLKWAVLAGIMMDLAYFWPVGTSVFSFSFIAYGVNSLAKRFLVAQTAFRFLIIAGVIIFGTVLNGIFTYVAVKFAGREIMELNLAAFAMDILLKTLYNIAIFSIIYVPLKKLEKLFSSFNLRFKSTGNDARIF